MTAKQIVFFISYNLLEAFKYVLWSLWSLGDVHEEHIKETWQGGWRPTVKVGLFGEESMQGDLDRILPNEQNKAVCGVPQSYAHK